MNKEQIEEYIIDNYPDADILLADGLEEAFLGIAQQFNACFAIYDRDKCIQIFMRDGLSFHEAEEHFEFNVQGAYVGETTPAFIEFKTDLI